MRKQMVCVLVTWCLAAAVALAWASDPLAGPVAVTQVTRVVDGDTFDVVANVWLGQWVAARVRIRNIDAPELNHKCTGDVLATERAKRIAHRAQRYLDGLFRNEAGMIKLWNVSQKEDPFGRIVADVTVDGMDLAAILVKAGIAKTTQGSRADWCDGGR